MLERLDYTSMENYIHIAVFFFSQPFFPLLKAFYPSAAKRLSGKYFRVTGFRLSLTY